MKTGCTILLLLFSICAPGQSRKFKSIKEYETWMMNYYKNPEPAALFDGFNYGVHNKQIAKAGNRSMIVAFYSSCFRADTLTQNIFFENLRETEDEDFIYPFSLALWMAHTEHSMKVLDGFIKQKNIGKYKEDLESMKSSQFLDLWKDPIVSPEHLDLLWADFFATGNEASVKKIITKLSDLNDSDIYSKTAAESAQWSLTSNAVKHSKVLDTCKQERESSTRETRKALDQIVDSAEKGGKRN